MSYRNKRVAAVVRGIVSDTIANRLSDPRISRLTSVTGVEVTADLEFADVYVSVMGTDGEATTTMKGLQSARGLVQRQIARKLDIRKCPELRLHLDHGLKIARQTLQQLDEVLPGLPPDTTSDEGPARPPGATE